MSFVKLLRCLVPAVALLPSTAGAADHCLGVQSRQGWQRLDIPAGTVSRVSYSGGWTVINGQYGTIGPRGYAGADARRLAPLTGFKFDQAYAFGELLVRDQAGRTIPFAEFAALAPRVADPRGIYAFRINDLDIALRDNAGAITVCISMR